MRPPRQINASWIQVRRLRINHSLGDFSKRVQRSCHRPDDRWNVLLPFSRHRNIIVWEPTTLGTVSDESSRVPTAELTLGLSPYKPIMLLGWRIDAPISVPNPTIEPLHASKADSPPEEPPGVKDGSFGLTVRPQRGLIVSAICIQFSPFCRLNQFFFFF